MKDGMVTSVEAMFSSSSHQCESCRRNPVEVVMSLGGDLFFLCRDCAAEGRKEVTIHEAILQVCHG